ncbi:hypothetical protein CPB97_008222 [Podila verticillata]|nr:hypothetical protein CPB97_008222 [Podila verticillata]
MHTRVLCGSAVESKVALAPPNLKTLVISADCHPAKCKSFNLNHQLLETFVQHSHYLETVLLDRIELQGLMSPLEKSAVRKVYMSVGTKAVDYFPKASVCPVPIVA